MSGGAGYGLFLAGAEGLGEDLLARGLGAAFGRSVHDIGVAAGGFDATARDRSRPVLH